MAADDRVYNVLFLCTHNSARSIMAEAYMNNLAVGRGRFKAWSAGSMPSGKPHPYALEQIASAGLPLTGLRSKNWDEFAAQGSPRLDFVFTVCDNAANEVCPVWPGQPMTAHWGVPDPSQVEGSDEEKRRAFFVTFRYLANRINLFVNLPLDKLDKLALQKKLDEIGKNVSLARRLAAEALGTAFLLMVVVGSGIMGERLAAGNAAIALLANSLATGCGLGVLIAICLPISGAHFNPAVTLAMATRGDLPWRDVLPYILVQFAAALAGVAAAHMMFGEPLFFASAKARTGWSQWWSEFVAAYGLLMVIWCAVRQKNVTALPWLVAAWITAAYWFTGSTSFANPAVTVARSASDTFAGIRPDDVIGFIASQLAGALAATWTVRWLLGARSRLPE